MSVRCPGLLLLAGVALACGGSTDTPQHAERQVAAGEPEVPDSVRDRGDAIARRLGEQIRCADWTWDTEDADWTCVVSGLPRDAELELLPDGGFSELELVLDFAQVRRAAPIAAETILATCPDPERIACSLVLRTEDLITDDPRLDAMWGRDGVSIEADCGDGNEFEVDAYGAVVTTTDDAQDTEHDRAGE